MSTVICLLGPTASGKTQIALEIAQHFPVEIISVDSAMVYRGMDVGTAKPSKDELSRVSHHLIDIRDPADPYSVAQFQTDVSRLIPQILGRKNIPLLAGGTMLYLNALQNGLSPLPSADSKIRAVLLNEAKEHGWEYLHAKLASVDPASAQKIKPTDPQRIQRALEVYELTQQPLSEWWLRHPKIPFSYQMINLVVTTSNREKLHKKISQRFHNMLDQGFVQEVTRLYERGDLHLDLPAIRSVGYRQIWLFLSGQLTYNEMIERGIIATRQLAKRQLTWLRSWKNCEWFDNQSDVFVQDIMGYLKNSILFSK